MGVFTKKQKQASERLYETEVKEYLHEQDGFKHILMINSFSRWANQAFTVENKYTTQINEVMDRMQEDGYEIIDIKLESQYDQGSSGGATGFNTLIIYK